LTEAQDGFLLEVKSLSRRHSMNKGTNILVAAVLCVLAVSYSFAAGGQQDTAVAKQYTMKLGHDQMEGTPHHVAALLFKKLVEERTNGNVVVNIFPAQQLGSAREMNEGMQIGTIEAVCLPTATFSGFDLTVGITDLPFIFPNPEVAYKVLDGPVGDQLLKRLEKVNIIGGAYWTSGFKQFTGNFPIRVPTDYRGKKIRVMSHPVLIAQYEAMGASAIPIDFHELYNALQQRAIDGQENPLATIVNMRFYEVQSHMTISNHGMLGYILAFSKTWMDTLPANYRQIILAAAKEVAPFERAELHKLETEKYLPTIRDSGTTIITLTENERKAFEEVTRPVYQKLSVQLDAAGNQLLKDLLAAIDAAR
jgi:C4-dicarboxylate-binding protein DctP